MVIALSSLYFVAPPSAPPLSFPTSCRVSRVHPRSLLRESVGERPSWYMSAIQGKLGPWRGWKGPYFVFKKLIVLGKRRETGGFKLATWMSHSKICENRMACRDDHVKNTAPLLASPFPTLHHTLINNITKFFINYSLYSDNQINYLKPLTNLIRNPQTILTFINFFNSISF